MSLLQSIREKSKIAGKTIVVAEGEEQRVLDAKLSSFIAAKELLDIYFGDKMHE